MKVGDLVKLAKWCKNGPELMHIIGIESRDRVKALYLGGSKLGSIATVYTGNIFALEDYDEAMRKHYESR